MASAVSSTEEVKSKMKGVRRKRKSLLRKEVGPGSFHQLVRVMAGELCVNEMSGSRRASSYFFVNESF